MTNAHEVVIAGGGPTGLMLADELRLAGVDAVIVEQHPGPRNCRHARWRPPCAHTEVFDQRGIVDRFVSEGQKAQVAGFAGVNSTSTVSRPGTPTGSACGKTISSGS